ncbi:MAG TPA: hypothetical protein VMU66_04925 [Gaiellales bacterium]|nr:hypothetical protein [Gaiellales bacterium]
MQPSLTVAEVDAVFMRMAAASGGGAGRERRELLAGLFARATADEAELLAGLVAGELRQGAQRGVFEQAVARAAGVSPQTLRRALMLSGDLGVVAAAALAGGEAALDGFRLELGRPILPMLAVTAADLRSGIERLGDPAVEWKLDGARVQIHRSGGDVAVFTRSLDDITARVPELVDAALALPVTQVVLDGEAIDLDGDGRPAPFQVASRRIGSSRATARLAAELPLTPILFDLLHLDGDDLLDHPGERRAAGLARVVPAGLVVPRLVGGDHLAVQEFLPAALARGHDGVILKARGQPYQAGRLAAGWLKVKPAHTLDLVVLAAEWGHGRRSSLLSNLHRGALARGGGGHVMLGKTFKGLTDEMLAWQTARLLELETSRDGHVVHVRPELVVEVAFDGVQTSPRYPGGVALRFARVRAHRPDKRPSEADTIDMVLALRPRLTTLVGVPAASMCALRPPAGTTLYRDPHGEARSTRTRPGVPALIRPAGPGPLTVLHKVGASDLDGYGRRTRQRAAAVREARPEHHDVIREAVTEPLQPHGGSSSGLLKHR